MCRQAKERIGQVRFECTGISRYFKRIEVVPQKDADVLRRVTGEEGASPSTTWVIGGSIKSDINPALEVGAKCVLYLYTHASYRWLQEYGDAPKGPFYVAKALAEIRDIIESPARFTMVATL
jgi:putative hydrolase of the HAD superfamily